MTPQASIAPIKLGPFLREVWKLYIPGEIGEIRHWYPLGVRQEFLQYLGDGWWCPLAPRKWPSDTIMFGLNPRVRPDGHRDAIDYQVALFADLDDWEGSAPKVQQLAAAGIRPSAVVKSGSTNHGHLHFLLADRVPVSEGEATARRLCHALGSDSVFYPNVSPRLPGSLNVKDPRAPRPVELVEFSNLRYGLHHVDAVLDSWGVPPAAALLPAKRPTERRAVALVASPVDPGRINLIWGALPTWAQTLIRAGKQPGDRYPSRSEADCAVVRTLLDTGATEDEIRWFFADNIVGIGSRYAEQGDRYLEQTIDFIERASAAESWAVVERIAHRGPGSRVVLGLRVYFGAHAGATFQQGVESSRSVWPYLFLSGGIAPATSGDASRALALLDRDLRLVIEETKYGGERRLQVKRFLPQVSQ